MGGAGGSSTSGLATVFPRTLEVQTMVVMVLVTWLTVVGGKDDGCKVELRGMSRGLGSSVSAVSWPERTMGDSAAAASLSGWSRASSMSSRATEMDFGVPCTHRQAA